MGGTPVGSNPLGIRSDGGGLLLDMLRKKMGVKKEIPEMVRKFTTKKIKTINEGERIRISLLFNLLIIKNTSLNIIE